MSGLVVETVLTCRCGRARSAEQGLPPFGRALVEFLRDGRNQHECESEMRKLVVHKTTLGRVSVGRVCF